MTGLAARLRLLLGALAVCGLVALCAPAVAQAQLVDPDASVVNEQTLLREAPRIQGDIDQLDPQARVLIQPAGRVWDHFHEVTLYWLAAAVILGTLAALAAAYLLLGPLRVSAGLFRRQEPRPQAVDSSAPLATASSLLLSLPTALHIPFLTHLLPPLSLD